MSKLNVLAIVTAHVRTLRDYRTDKASVSDVFVFFIVPLVVAVVAVWYGVGFGSPVLSGLLEGFSIFAGLLLNLLVLVCGFSGTPKFSGTDQGSSERRQFLSEVNDNLSFSILLSIGVVLVCLVALLLEGAEKHPVVTFLLSLFVANFLLTLLLVLKRVHALLSDEFKRPSLRKSA